MWAWLTTRTSSDRHIRLSFPYSVDTHQLRNTLFLDKLHGSRRNAENVDLDLFALVLETSIEAARGAPEPDGGAEAPDF